MKTYEHKTAIFKTMKSMIKNIYDTSAKTVGLSYHNWNHTAQVLTAIDELVAEEPITIEDYYLLKIGGLFHDIGNIIARKDHEKRSATYASMILPYYGFNDSEINTVSNIILATRIPQEPSTRIEKIMCDADLSLIGSTKWDKIIDNYRLELGITDKSKWYENQYVFLKNHKWLTESAEKLYDDIKYENMELCNKKHAEINNIPYLNR